jgi:uncharacterized damage-inducible protein DinB
MKRILTIAIVLLCAATSAFSQTRTAADRDRALQYLESTRQAVLDATAGLSEAQWNFKPAPDRWSIAEVVEHIAAAEDYLMGMVTSQVMKAPARPAGDDVKAIDDMVVTKVPDRSRKAQAPEPLKPTNRFGSPQASLKHFTDARAQTEVFLKTHDDLRDHAIDSPMGKKLDGYEWVLFVAGHSERHTKQINEVKARSEFPQGVKHVWGGHC